jgi:hypothetical protein
MSTASNNPTPSEVLEGISMIPISIVICSTVAPGFILCIPGLILITFMVALPLIALALAAAVLAAPVLAVRGIRHAVQKSRTRVAAPARIMPPAFKIATVNPPRR